MSLEMECAPKPAEEERGEVAGKAAAAVAKEGDKGGGTKAKKVPFLKLFAFADAWDAVLMAIGTFAACVHGAAVPVFFVFFGKLIDVMGIAYLFPASVSHKVAMYSLDFVYLGIVMLFSAWAEVACWMHTGERQAAKMRMAYLRSMLAQDIGLFDTEATTAEVISAITGDIIVVQEALSEKVGNCVHYVSRFFAGFAVGFAYVWQISLVTLSIVPLIAIAGGIYAYVAIGLIARVRRSYVEAGEIAEEALGNIRTVQAFVGEERAVRSYKDALAKTYMYGKKGGLAKGLGLGSLHCVLFLSWALLVWFTSIVVHKGISNGGESFTTMLNVVISGLSLGLAAPNMATSLRARTAAYPIFQMIERNTANGASARGGKVLPSVDGHIQFQHVCFSYPSRPDVTIFDRFCLDIPAGKVVALVGGSGSGKSTAISLIERFYEPSSGEILLDGHGIKGLDLRWLRGQIGLVNQEPALFAASIRENILYGKDDATPDEIRRAAKLSEAFTFINNLPDRYETQVGERGIQLSGGQKQRIAISRAILKNPAILLLDEATSALDAESEKSVQEALDRVMMGRTTVVVAHRLSTIRNADVIAVVQGGKVVETGTHEQLMVADPRSAYSSLVQLQEASSSLESASPPPGGGGGRRSPHWGAAATPRRYNQRYIGGSPSPGGGGGRRSPATPRWYYTPPHISGSTPSPGGGSRRSPATPRWYTPPYIRATSFGASLEEECLSPLRPSGGKDELTEPEPVPLRKLYAMVSHDWIFALFGTVGAFVTGAQMPLFALGVTQALVSYYMDWDTTTRREVREIALLFCGGAVVTVFFHVVEHLSFGIMGERLTLRVREKMFAALLQNEIGWFDEEDNTSSVLASRLETDAALLKTIVVDRSTILLQNVGMVVCSLIIAFLLNWRITLLLLATYPLVVSGHVCEKLFLNGFGGDLGDAYLKANMLAAEAVGNIRTVAAFCCEEKVMNLYSKQLEQPSRRSFRRGQTAGILYGLSQFFIFSSYALALWYGSVLMAKELASFKSVMKTFMVLIVTALAMGETLALAPDIVKGNLRTAASAVFEILDRAAPTAVAGEEVRKMDGAIEMKGVEFRYPSRPDVVVFRNFDLKVKAGRSMALVGASGSGKSTVLSLILRFYDPTAGEVLIDGRDIKKVRLGSLRRHVGLVQQEPALFATTIYENILYGKDGATEAEVIEAARLANAHAFISALPEGYATRVGERGVQLSGGQKQRVAIARAVLRNPSVLLLDEATSALDAESERVVRQALDRVTKSRTTVMVAHRLSTIRNADLISVLQDGRIVEQGSHSSLVKKKNGAYYKLICLQQQQEEATMAAIAPSPHT